MLPEARGSSFAHPFETSSRLPIALLDQYPRKAYQKQHTLARSRRRRLSMSSRVTVPGYLVAVARLLPLLPAALALAQGKDNAPDKKEPKPPHNSAALEFPDREL